MVTMSASSSRHCEFIYEHLPFYGMAVLCVDDATYVQIWLTLPSPLQLMVYRITAQVRASDIRHSEGQMHFTALVE